MRALLYCLSFYFKGPLTLASPLLTGLGRWFDVVNTLSEVCICMGSYFVMPKMLLFCLKCRSTYRVVERAGCSAIVYFLFGGFFVWEGFSPLRLHERFQLPPTFRVMSLLLHYYIMKTNLIKLAQIREWLKSS